MLSCVEKKLMKNNRKKSILSTLLYTINMNAKLYTGYFTDDKCALYREGNYDFLNEWKSYVRYHKTHETVSSKNAIVIMEEFRCLIAKIQSSMPHDVLKTKVFHQYDIM